MSHFPIWARTDPESPNVFIDSLRLFYAAAGYKRSKRIMHSVSSFRGSAVSGEVLSAIVADHMALERVRLFRRALVPRCGALVLLAIVFDLMVHNLSAGARWAPPAVFAIPPTWAWIVELRLKHRLAIRLDAVDESESAILPVAEDPSDPAA